LFDLFTYDYLNVIGRTRAFSCDCI